MNSAQDLVGHASALVQQGRLPEAREALRLVVESAPGMAEAWHLAGMVEMLSGAPAAGLPLLRRCVELAPAVPFAWSNLGVAYNANGDFTNALACFEKSLSLAPGVPATLKNQGIALRQLGRHEEAMASFRRAAQREPNDYELNREVGDLLVDMGRPAEALSRYDRALAANPRDVATHHHRGFAALRAGDAVRAEADLRRALELAPGNPFVENDLGIVLEALGRREEAVGAYGRALAADPGYVDALENRAAAHAESRRYREALSDYERVESLAPGRRHNAGHRLQAKLGLCDWAGYDALLAQIAAGLAAGRAEAQPFPSCHVPLPPTARRACAEMYARELAGPAAITRSRPGPYRHDRLRVGYFSADFRDHPVGQLIAPLVESHDRSRVEVYAFSWGAATGDDTHQRLTRAFDRFEDVRRENAGAIAALARRHGIDVAVDLMGHTSGARTAIFMHGAAPVQAQYLGFPGTMGADCIDYIVADPLVIPGEDRAHYTERVALVDGPALVAERGRAIDATPERAALGLPGGAFVFCCFCTRAKITPDAFDAWMRIVSAVEGSVLWLADPGDAAAANLRAEATRRDVAPERLRFAARVPTMAAHLARLAAADLFLDTFHYNGHVTTSDALYAGLPVVTRLGDGYPSRVSASLLRGAGLDELVTRSTQEYEALALRIAREPSTLARLRERLPTGRSAHAAFDVERLARGLEALYARMVERHREGQPPGDLGA